MTTERNLGTTENENKKKKQKRGTKRKPKIWNYIKAFKQIRDLQLIHLLQFWLKSDSCINAHYILYIMTNILTVMSLAVPVYNSDIW